MFVLATVEQILSQQREYQQQQGQLQHLVCFILTLKKHHFSICEDKLMSISMQFR
jgi:hypothetical protein